MYLLLRGAADRKPVVGGGQDEDWERVCLPTPCLVILLHLGSKPSAGSCPLVNDRGSGFVLLFPPNRLRPRSQRVPSKVPLPPLPLSSLIFCLGLVLLFCNYQPGGRMALTCSCSLADRWDRKRGSLFQLAPIIHLG